VLLSDDSLATLEERIVARDPFRLSNRASAVRYDAFADATVLGAPGMPPSSAVPRPVLELRAIVGGPPWQAIIDGLPGQQPGTTAQPGSRFDKLVVRAVTRDTVIVQGPDTTWVLSFRRRS